MQGTPEHWKSATWRLYFLRHVISLWLLQNLDRYNETFGFTFSWEGVISGTGWDGYFAAYIGEIKDPTSDDENDVGYLPTSTLYSFGGEIMEYGYKVSFYFRNVSIGKKMEGVGQS